MKTSTTSVSGSSFRTAIAIFVLIVTLFAGQVVSAQNIIAADNSSITSKISEGFQAAIHPIFNTLKMKVHVVNPASETISVIIENSDNQEVFRKKMGTQEVIHSSFDVANMPNGIYKITVRSTKHTYSRSFVIESQAERIAKAL